ncbi:hypothetical protein N7453_003294 [Penicillium expansum]|nr:hypothetical protein N7453_003294 [Penicillium expansum]
MALALGNECQAVLKTKGHIGGWSSCYPFGLSALGHGRRSGGVLPVPAPERAEPRNDLLAI